MTHQHHNGSSWICSLLLRCHVQREIDDHVFLTADNATLAQFNLNVT